MTNVLRWAVVVALVCHGLIHLLGVAKGFGWARVPQLREPIGVGGGALWLLAGLLVLASAAFIAVGAPVWWWLVAGCGALVSQVAIVMSWSDARAGTLLNVALVLVAAYGFLSVGPPSFHAQWQERATHALADVDPAPAVLTETDLDGLPAPLAEYIRRSGAVGRPRVVSLYADFHGRIRSGPDAAWMTFTGKQINTFGPRPQRLFIMDATRSGLPVTVLHAYQDATATMRAKAISLVTVVDAAGPEMDRGETVTVFNDLVVLAPGAIVDAPVRWTTVDAHHVRGVFAHGGQTVTADLTFDEAGDLVDFVSEDRLRASDDGRSFTPQRWSTPLSGHRDDEQGQRVPTSGQGRWLAPEGWFTYVELHFDDVAHNVRSADGTAGAVPVPRP
ncbi:DUF6544 family protein [Nocardioides campestrisoli]|uniref:DUF6544 family protein n=1 Tax=Nocardioides campestrisoli TaxID=2736757 RepID=UPI00163D5D5B|nr:DUF6544 family protein [Nocardioides campestrisoli]